MKNCLYYFIFLLFCTFYSGIRLFGLAKEEGMGGVGTAYPQAATTANFNPAVITALGNRLDVDVGFIYQWGRHYIRGSQNRSFNGTAGPQFKYVPVSIAGISKQLTPNLFVALTTDATRAIKYTLDKTFRVFGHGKQGLEDIEGLIVPTLAWKLNQAHSFGVSLPIVLARSKVKGIQNGAVTSLYPDNYSNKGYDWAYGLGLRLGWYWHVRPCLDFGLFYSSHLLTASHFHKYKGLLPAKGKLEIAPEVRVGFAYYWERATLTVDLQYHYYNQVRALSNSAHSRAPAGSKNGPGSGWRNQFFIRAGADYQLNETWTIRAGFRTMIPPLIRGSNTIANFLNPYFVTKTFVSAGFTYRYNCTTEINVGYFYGVRRFVRGKRELALANGHLDMLYESHNVLVGFGKIF